MKYSFRKVAQHEFDHHFAAIEKNGFSIVENAIPDLLMEDILAELAQLEQLRPGGDVPPRAFSGFVTRRWFDVLNDGDVWLDVPTHPMLVRIMQQVLGEGFLLSTMGAALIGPGEPSQPLHADDQGYAIARPHRPIVCNSMWALGDFTEANGATRIIAGSHLNPELPRADKNGETHYDTIPIEMAQGSIAIFLGSAWHGAGFNTSETIRSGLTVNYCGGAIRQQENYMLAIHPERLMSFPRELQDILGFKLINNNGHVFGDEPRTELARRFAVNKEAGRGNRSRRNSLFEAYLATQENK